MNDDEQLLRYSRHILLDEIGIEGQQRLVDAKALIVGAGGLGSPAALYLAPPAWATSPWPTATRSTSPTCSARSCIRRSASASQGLLRTGRHWRGINPEVQVEAITSRLAGEALAALVADADVVLDCCDNFATRHAVNRECVRQRKPLVSGAAIRFAGQLRYSTVGRQGTPCYSCLFPEGDDVEEERCAVMGVFAPLTGIIGAMQAAEALKLIAGAGEVILGRLWLLDGLSMEWRSVSFGKDPQCPVCAEGHHPPDTAIIQPKRVPAGAGPDPPGAGRE
jgi:molybdopterin/thiamine biosynthesis adenylyltransferase